MPATIQSGKVTALVCDSTECGREVRAVLDGAAVRVPEDLSLVAVGCCHEAYPCSGQYVESRLLVQTVAELLKAGCGPRPTTLWLAPRWVDNGTTRPAGPTRGEGAA